MPDTIDPITRAEQARYTLRAAYQLVRADITRLIATRATFGGNNDRLEATVAVLDSRLDSLELAPNE